MHKHNNKKYACMEYRNYITVTTATKGTTTRAGMPARVATQQQGNKKKRDKNLQQRYSACVTERMPATAMMPARSGTSVTEACWRKITQK
jgi:hypothetical protein